MLFLLNNERDDVNFYNSYTRKNYKIFCTELVLNNLFHSRTKFLLIYHSFLLCFQTRPYYILFYTIVYFCCCVIDECIFIYIYVPERRVCAAVLWIFLYTLAWNEYCIEEHCVWDICRIYMSLYTFCSFNINIAVVVSTWPKTWNLK